MIFLYNLLQDEWQLILNFIVTFPSVIKSTVPKITLKSHNVIIQTNKVNIHAELPKSLHRAIFSWSWNKNARTKQKQQTNGNRAIWLAYRTDTNTRGFWLVKRTLMWKNFMPKELSRNHSILCFDVILQHDWPIEQWLLHIRVFFGGKTKSPCFDLFIHWLIKTTDEHVPKPFFKVIRKSLYNLTSPYGHRYNMDTSLLRIVRLVPEMPKIIHSLPL